MCPDVVLPRILERVYPALETLTETHQTHSALQALSMVAIPMFTHSHYPDGAQHLTRLLALSGALRVHYCERGEGGLPLLSSLVVGVVECCGMLPIVAVT